jgi:hypothetical protein
MSNSSLRSTRTTTERSARHRGGSGQTLSRPLLTAAAAIIATSVAAFGYAAPWVGSAASSEASGVLAVDGSDPTGPEPSTTTEQPATTTEQPATTTSQRSDVPAQPATARASQSAKARRSSTKAPTKAPAATSTSSSRARATTTTAADQTSRCVAAIQAAADSPQDENLMRIALEVC